MVRARAASSVSSPAVLALVLSAAMAPRAVEGTRAFVAYDGGEYGCMPQLHAEKTSPDSFHKPDASVVYMRLTGSGEEDACHGDAATYRDAFEDADVQEVAGRIALVRGSGCAFPAPSDPDADPLLLYARDFQARVDAAVEAGAVGVLWGEGAPGKNPSHVLAQRDAEHLEQAKPVCAMRRDAFDALLDAVGLDALPAGSYANGVDLTGAPMYRSSDETLPDPEMTYITVDEPWRPNGPDGFHYPVPARLATFNPDAIAARSAEMVRVAFRDECNALDYAACMASCWSATADPFATPVSGKVAVFARERAEDYACHNSFAEWAAVSVDAGAVAVLHASQSYDGYGWSFPGPYLVPFTVTAPFFALLKIHADALFEAEAESEAHSNHAVVVSTPALANREGPAFHAPREVVLGQTPLLFWKSERDHFFCDAGEAGFNPADFPGLPLPTYDDDDDADSSRLDSIRTNRVVGITPSDACEAGTSRAATCGECLTQGPRAQAKALWSLVDGELVTVAGGDPAAHEEAFGEDFIAALMVHELDCFATYEEFVDVAVAAGAAAALLVMPWHYLYAPSIYGTADVGDDPGGAAAREPIPTFTVTWGCWNRLVDGAASFRVDVPATDARGVAKLGAVAQAAGYDVGADAIAMRDTAVLVERGPATLCGDQAPGPGDDGKCRMLAGQAAFNPDQYPATRADVLHAATDASCRSLDTCVACDRLGPSAPSGGSPSGRAPAGFSWGRYVDPGTSRALDPGAIAGHLVYVDARDLACLRPYTNVVRDMQSAGALGVLLGNFPEDDVKTLAETAAPHDVSIPTFVLPRSSGAAIRDALLAGAGPVSITTPRIEDGEATASDDLGVSEGVLRGRGYGWGEKKKRVDGTAVAAFFVVLAFAGVAGAAVARYRRRPEGGPDGGGDGGGAPSARFFRNLLPNLLRPSVARRRGPNPAGPYARFEGDAAPEAGSHRAPADHIELAMTGPDAARRAVSISPGTGVGAYVLPNWRAVPLLDQSVRGGRERDATDAPSGAREEGGTPGRAEPAEGPEGPRGGGAGAVVDRFEQRAPDERAPGRGPREPE